MCYNHTMLSLSYKRENNKVLYAHKAFSLSEVMLSLAILGILATILIPIVFSVLPDKQKLKFKRAYYTLEQAVDNLINDESLYPETGPTYKGFAAKSGQDFCNNISNFLNVIGDVSCGSVQSVSNCASTVTPAFMTTDGSVWWGFNQTGTNPAFTVGTNSYITVCVNVEGESGDGIPIQIRYDGRIKVPAGSRGAEYLKTVDTK